MSVFTDLKEYEKFEKKIIKKYNIFIKTYPNEYYLYRLQLWCNNDVFKKYVIVKLLNRANLLRFNKKGFEELVLCKLIMTRFNNLFTPTLYRETSADYNWSRKSKKAEENKITLEKTLNEAENIKIELYTQLFRKTKIPNMLFSLIIEYIHGDSLTATPKNPLEYLD